MLDVPYDNLHHSCEYSNYLPEEDVVEIFYYLEELEGYESKKYEIDLEKIGFYPFTSN